jgi:hypothetical protein
MGDGDRTWFATLLEAKGAAQTQVGRPEIKWTWNGPENRWQSDPNGLKTCEEAEEARTRAEKSLLASSNMGTAILPVAVANTPSTPATQLNRQSVAVEGIEGEEGGATAALPPSSLESAEGVEDAVRLPQFTWIMDDGIFKNAHRLGVLLASMPHLQLY